MREIREASNFAKRQIAMVRVSSTYPLDPYMVVARSNTTGRTPRRCRLRDPAYPPRMEAPKILIESERERKRKDNQVARSKRATMLWVF